MLTASGGQGEFEEHDTDLGVEEILETWHHLEVDEGVLDSVQLLAGRALIRTLTTNQPEQRAAWMQTKRPPDNELFDAHRSYAVPYLPA